MVIVRHVKHTYVNSRLNKRITVAVTPENEGKRSLVLHTTAAATQHVESVSFLIIIISL